MNDHVFYDKVAEELKARTMVAGVWARAFAEANGELDKARAFYIKLRVAELKHEVAERLEIERRASVVATRQKALSGFRGGILWVLAVVFGLLTLVFGLGIIYPFAERSAEAIVTGVVSVLASVVFGVATHKCLKAAQS